MVKYFKQTKPDPKIQPSNILPNPLLNLFPSYFPHLIKTFFSVHLTSTWDHVTFISHTFVPSLSLSLSLSPPSFSLSLFSIIYEASLQFIYISNAHIFIFLERSFALPLILIYSIHIAKEPKFIFLFHWLKDPPPYFYWIYRYIRNQMHLRYDPDQKKLLL